MESKTNLMRVEFGSNYDIPEFKELCYNKDSYVYCGEDNQYPNHLITLLDASSKHNAIVLGVADMIKGEGFKIDPTSAPEASLKLNKWLENPNPFETANDILEKVAIDLKLFGGFYLQQTWSRDKTQIIETYHIPFQEMRVSSDGKEFYRSDKWGIGTRKYTKYPAFNPKTAEGGKAQVFFYKMYRPGLTYYPLPDYISGKQNIETDAEIANFHNNHIKTGFSAGTIVTFFNGEPTLEEKKEIERNIKRKHTGTDNSGGFILNFVDKPDQEPKISRLQPDEMDKQYIELYKTVSDEIFIAHRITNPSIFGVKVAGQLGSRQDLIDSKEMFYTDYVKGKVAIIERVFNYFMEWIAKGGSIVIPKATAQDSTGDTNAAPQAMAKQRTEADVLQIFEQFGEPASNYRIIKSRRLRFDADAENEEAFKHDFSHDFEFAEPLNITISDVHAKVLGAIKENPKLTIADISNLTGLSIDEVNKAYTYLVDEGVIKTVDGETVITDRGLKTIDEADLVTTEIFVKYKYAGVRDNRNRPFCAKVLDMDRLYTRQDIDSISDAAGYNVWLQRGGWYHNPKTDVNTPYCRHFWNQVIVKKKTRL